jgi:MFS-type transporter involved in bile tolerance (Atg22 family)
MAQIRGHRALVTGVCSNFSGWVALYTIPSLNGASSDYVVIMATVGQLIAAALTPVVGRMADKNQRRVGISAAFGLATALLMVAIDPPLLAHPVFGGLGIGWWLCDLFFALGETCGNVNQGSWEASLSRVDSEPEQAQLIALGVRFLIVGSLNIVLALLKAALTGVVSGTFVGAAIGVVCAGVVLAGFRMAVRKM